ncbi:hypothetical protein PRIO_4946 [Paenibacillus riograndensis SBR5]|uniref:Uncharacterized protein n=1 Tax=Paenibacillus riograndensis SBR5 TaxID=1073571 RepID=A0A0E3WIN5_9BACL|nr:hypothetical protein PRIO_4946 [Paenibacillus riograndensis SBR5]
MQKDRDPTVGWSSIRRLSGLRSPYLVKNLAFSAVTDTGAVISFDGVWNKGKREK